MVHSGLPDTHQLAKGWPEHYVWNPFSIKTLLERAGPRMGAPTAGPCFSGAWVSGSPSWVSGTPSLVIRPPRRTGKRNTDEKLGSNSKKCKHQNASADCLALRSIVFLFGGPPSPQSQVRMTGIHGYELP